MMEQQPTVTKILVQETQALLPTNDAPGTLRFTTRVLGVDADFVIVPDGKSPTVKIEWRRGAEFCFAKRGVFLRHLHEEVCRLFNAAHWVVKALERTTKIEEADNVNNP